MAAYKKNDPFLIEAQTSEEQLEFLRQGVAAAFRDAEGKPDYVNYGYIHGAERVRDKARRKGRSINGK